MCVSGFSDPLCVFFNTRSWKDESIFDFRTQVGKKNSNFFEDLREEMILMDFFCCSSFVLSAFLFRVLVCSRGVFNHFLLVHLYVMFRVVFFWKCFCLCVLNFVQKMDRVLESSKEMSRCFRCFRWGG